MKKIIVATSFGYYRDQAGHVVAKAELPPGEHQLADDLDYIEVPNAEALAMVEVYQPPKTEGQLNEEKIRAKMRQLAINALITEGQLPGDYK